MLMSFNELVVETEEDLYDYVTRGPLPSRKDRIKLLDAIDTGAYDDLLDDSFLTMHHIRRICENREKNFSEIVIAISAVGTAIAAMKLIKQLVK